MSNSIEWEEQEALRKITPLWMLVFSLPLSILMSITMTVGIATVTVVFMFGLIIALIDDYGAAGLIPVLIAYLLAAAGAVTFNYCGRHHAEKIMVYGFAQMILFSIIGAVILKESGL